MATPEVDPAVSELSGALLPEAAELAKEMAARIRAEIPLYREGDAVAEEELVRSCTDNLRYILGSLAGSPVDDGDAPRRTGAARAEQGVPYPSVLQAYRIGGRFVWELLVERSDAAVHDILLRAAADIWTVTDDLSAYVTDAYRAAQADQARRDDQIRASLLGTLLEDTSGSERLREAAGLLNLPRTGELVVVSAECPAAGDEALPGVEGFLARRDVVSVWRLDHDHQEGLVVLRPGFRATDLATTLADLAHGRVGMSSVLSRVEGAPAARREAQLACTAATPGTSDLAVYDDHALAVLVASTPDTATQFARRVLGPLLALPPEDCRTLLETARVWLEEAGSSSAAAKRLYLHRNTVRYRTRRIEELTGRDLAHPVDAAELHVALECARILGLG
ncbi:MAG TPA: helix-turn-helix domain-containing protein [Nocardioidaceae bacterium]|nr:helix-turn-helix domain-containing protein [Nocardioidaceae bacterium]